MHYQAFLAERRYLMARFARDDYGKLSDHGYTPNAAEEYLLHEDDVRRLQRSPRIGGAALPIIVVSENRDSSREIGLGAWRFSFDYVVKLGICC